MLLVSKLAGSQINSANAQKLQNIAPLYNAIGNIGASNVYTPSYPDYVLPYQYDLPYEYTPACPGSYVYDVSPVASPVNYAYEVRPEYEYTTVGDIAPVYVNGYYLS